MSRISNLFTSSCLAVLLSCAGSLALAQADTETQPTDENGLALGEPEGNSPRVGDTYVKETFGDWSLRCIFVADQEDPCQMYQLLSDPSGQPIAEFTLFRLPEGGQAAAGATIVVPLETSLQQQLSIRVDDNQGRRYPYAFCNAVGCYARIGLTMEDVEMYKRGAQAVVSLVPEFSETRAPISVTLSLSGFTAAFDVVSVLEP